MDARLFLSIAPAQPALTLEVAKAHLRVTGAADNEYIEACVEAAVGEVESQIGRALINRTYDWKADGFENKSCMVLRSKRCFVHTRGGERFKRFRIWFNNKFLR